jgi:hypothetical protein
MAHAWIPSTHFTRQEQRISHAELRPIIVRAQNRLLKGKTSGLPSKTQIILKGHVVHGFMHMKLVRTPRVHSKI